jgi:hypothetical protein
MARIRYQRALLSYGPNRIFEAERVAGYVQKVLTGAKPADLPIEQPVKIRTCGQPKNGSQHWIADWPRFLAARRRPH